MILYVCGRRMTPRGHVAYIFVHFDLFLITFVIKKTENSHWNTNKKFHPFPKINTSFVSQKIQIYSLSCAADLKRITIHLSSNVCPSYMIYLLW